MKKSFIPISLFIFICIILNSCGVKHYSEDDFSVYDISTHQNIKLNTTQNKIDEILGKPDIKNSIVAGITEANYENGLTIMYDENLSYEIKINYSNHDRYKFMEFTAGSSVENFLKKFKSARGYLYRERKYSKIVIFTRNAKNKYIEVSDINNVSLGDDLIAVNIEYDNYNKIETLIISNHIISAMLKE